MQFHRSRTARRAALALIAVGVLATTAACSGSTSGLSVAQTGTAGVSPAGATAGASSAQSSSDSSGSSSSSSSSSSSAAPKPVATVTASPAFDQEISPTEPVKISVGSGTITNISVTNPEGVEVEGTISADKTSWTLGEPLGYSKEYTVAGTATGTDGKTVDISGAYTTVTPVDEITTSISPSDGAEVGVAMPVTVHLGYEPADRALIESQIKITTTPAVEGAWVWIQKDGDPNPSLDWRPKNYWPAGTQVHVESNIYGLDFGDGYYGGDNVTSDFTIGRNQVVLADANAHNIVVQRDGVTIATYDGSYGSGDEVGDPNRVTRSGVHVVNDMQETTKMSNPAYGYVNITEHWAVRISNNGEFIHQNQDTVYDQGVVNVSHGCINLSAESAQAYYESAMIGDPVEVTGTSVQLSPADGDIYDWSYSWDEWLALSKSGATAA